MRNLIVTIFVLLIVLTVRAQDFKVADKVEPAAPVTPTLSTEFVVFEDGFESYANGALTFGDWVTVDVDGHPVGGIDGFTFPNSGDPMAWTVVDWTPSATINAHTGAKTVATMYNNNAQPNNDWLISPPIVLSTNLIDAQLSFWTYILTTAYGPENLTVYISTDPGAVTPAQFTTTLQAYVINTPVVWEERILSLEAYKGNTVRIALRYHSTDAFTVLVDDFKVFGTDYVPVELTSFTAQVDKGSVTLNWATATELNNHGFEIQRKSEDGEYNTIAFVRGNGTTSQNQVYSFVDKNISSGTLYYRLKQIDFDGTFEFTSEVEVNIAPSEFALEQNFPNPFNPSTSISFSLASDANVSLKIFSVLGEEVAVLANNAMNAGVHTVNFDASNLNSGVYLYRIEANGVDGNNFTQVRKMMLTK